MYKGKRRIGKAILCAVLLIAAALCIFFLTGRFYKITDGAKSVTVFTHSKDVNVILRKSGIDYGESDAALAVKGGYRIVRPKSVTVMYGDETVSFGTCLDTVGDVVESSGIMYTSEDFCDYEDKQRVYDGMEIRVHKVTHDESVTDTEIPFDTVTRDSIYVKKGTTKVVQAGVPGIKRSVVKNTYVDGQLIAANATSDQIISLPSAQIVEQGVGGTIAGHAFSYCIDMKATAYTYSKTGTNRTATGVSVGYGKVAVDRKVIPLGTKLYIETANGKTVYGSAVAADTGVRGNTIDLFYETYEECISFGRRNVKVYILE